MRFEVGQVVAEGQPVVSIADRGEPEIVVDVPEDQLASFKTARFNASLDERAGRIVRARAARAGAAGGGADTNLPGQAEACRPQRLPLGASASWSPSAPRRHAVAAIPASAITQANGQPAVWVVRHARYGCRRTAGTVELVPVTVHGYRNDEVLVSGPPAGERIVTAGVQKMSPGLRVALPDAAPRIGSEQPELKQAAL